MEQRNYGLDAARICAMCGIITLHILGHGGVLDSCDFNSAGYWSSWWIEICAYCSVDLFALLSGWLGIYKKKHSVFRAAELLAVVLFYSVIITAIFASAVPDLFSGSQDIVNSVMPILAGRYWYITCYIPLAVLQPFINKMLLALSVRQHRAACLVSLVLFALLPTLLQVDFFALKDGYSFIWLAVCYMIGTYLRRLESEEQGLHCRYRALGMFFGGSFLLLAGNLCLTQRFGCDIHYFISYISPVTLLMAAGLLLYLKDIHVKWGRGAIKALASAAFDIYIIQCHPLIYDLILQDRFQRLAQLPAPAIPLFTAVCACGLYLVMALPGMLRVFLFEKLGVSRIMRAGAEKVDERIYLE